MTGKNYQNTDITLNGKYDPTTGTYYCGKNVSINSCMSPDAKRYIASRYYDYTSELANNDRMLTAEELHDNKCKAEAILQLMKKFDIPVSDYSDKEKGAV